MRRKKKISHLICLLLVALMLLLSFVSCRARGDTPTNDQSVVEQDPPTVDGITVEMLSEMKIVYAQNSPEEITKEADNLKELIKKSYGVDLLVSSDYIRQGSEIYCELPHEILIGETARPEDDTFYASIKEGDYGYTISNGKIIVGGGNTTATVKAVSEFAYDIVIKKKGGDHMFFCADYETVCEFNYPVSELKLNGASIQNYRIVYPADGSSFEKQVATYLSYNLLRLTGNIVPVVSDESAYANGYEVLIGKTNRSNADSLYTTTVEGMSGCIAGSGKLVALYGATGEGNASAVKALLSHIKSSASENDKKANLTISEAEVVSSSNVIATMTYNVYTGDVSTQRVELVSEMIVRYLPDVFGVQEANPTWMGKLNENFSEYYGSVGNGRDGGSKGEHSAIFYSKERFDLLESGTKWLTDTPDVVSILPESNYRRICTYALLKDRITGETICFVNTHLDFVEAQYEQAKRLFKILLDCGLEDYPIVLTGDMNARSTTPTIKYMKQMGLTSANDLADYTEGLPAIDFIMVSGECIDVSYARVCDEDINGVIPSDHSPTYAEFTVEIPSEGVDHDFREALPDLPDGWLEAERDESDEYGELNRAPIFNDDPLPEVPPDDGQEDPPADDPEENLPNPDDGCLETDQDEAGADYGQLYRP